MKKAIIIFSLLILVTPLLAGAQTLNTSLTVNEIGDVTSENLGLLPDSFFYPVKTWWEEVQLFFTLSDEKKADLELKFANRRLLELKKLCDEKDNCNLAEKLAPKFQNRIERSIQKLEKASDNGKEVNEIIEKLKENQEKQQAVLESVYEKVPDQAKEHILEAMEKSSKGLSNAIEKVQSSGEAEKFKNTVRQQVENYGQEDKVKIKERLNFSQDDQSNSSGSGNQNINMNQNQNMNQNMNTNSPGQGEANQAGQN